MFKICRGKLRGDPRPQEMYSQRGRQKNKLLIIGDYNAGYGAEERGYLIWATVRRIPERGGS